MPKRTNDFQQLIHFIYSQIVPEGATVTESVLLKEQNSPAKREVDILIEYEIAGTKLRIAVECRDRSRKDDIEWIDGLIGKYQDLGVDKVIAVSNSGFSADAIKKASAKKIDTRSLEQALNTDWTKEFIKLGIVTITQQIFVDQVEVEAEPALEEQPELTFSIVNPQGVFVCTLDGLLKDCYNRRIEKDIHKHLQQHFLELFKVLADLQKTLLSEQKVIPSNVAVIDKNGIAHKILSLTFHTRSVFATKEASIENHFFEKAHITSATIDNGESELLHITAVQIAGKKQGKVFLRSKPKKTIKKTGE